MDFIPRALSLCTFEMDESQIYELNPNDLPRNWHETPVPKATKDFGTKLLRQKHGILKIPSIIIPQEFNYILNPLAERISFKLLETKDFIYDLRIKANNTTF